MESKSGLKPALMEAKGFPVFSGIAPEVLEMLCSNGQVVISSHRETLFQFGEIAHYFGFVLSGAYKLSRPTPQGEDAIVHFVTPGDFIGALIMAQPDPRYPVTSTAMGPSRFIKIPRETFITHWRSQPELILRVQSALSARMGQLHSQRALQKAPLSAKVASLLMDLVDRQRDQKELVLPLPLTRKEIADSLGASVESVIRVMSDWSKRGIIQTSEQHIRILKPEQVISEMNPDRN